MKAVVLSNIQKVLVGDYNFCPHTTTFIVVPITDLDIIYDEDHDFE